MATRCFATLQAADKVCPICEGEDSHGRQGACDMASAIEAAPSGRSAKVHQQGSGQGPCAFASSFRARFRAAEALARLVVERHCRSLVPGQRLVAHFDPFCGSSWVRRLGVVCCEPPTIRFLTFCKKRSQKTSWSWPGA